MSKQARYDRYFMDIAERTAAMSYAEKRKVGCVIVRDNHIIAAGWNGMPAGFPNICEHRDEAGNLKTNPEVIHAEANALYWCARTEIITEGAICYVTLSPCKHCALGLIQSGISRVVYEEEYWNDDKTGLELLKKAGVTVEKIPAVREGVLT
jgi:dCMP deaminase